VLRSRLNHRPNKNKRVVFLVEVKHFMYKLLCKLKENYKEALKLANFQCTHSESLNAVLRFQETKLGSAGSLSVCLAGIRFTMRARTTKTMAIAVNQWKRDECLPRRSWRPTRQMLTGLPQIPRRRFMVRYGEVYTLPKPNHQYAIVAESHRTPLKSLFDQSWLIAKSLAG
jgi:hypothetical protein